MRLCWTLMALCMLGCGGAKPGRAETLAPASSPPAKAAPADLLPTLDKANPPMSSARQYLDTAMAAAYAEYEQAISECAQTADVASCETSAAATLDAAEKAIRLEYEARLQEEESRSDGG